LVYANVEKILSKFDVSCVIVDIASFLTWMK